MAIRTATVTVRTRPEVKAKAEKVFASIGLSTSDAVNLFFNQVAIRGEIPFQLRTRKSTATSRALEDMTAEEIDAMLQKSFDDYEAGRTYAAEEVFDGLEQELQEWYSK